ncbi:MAG: adenosine deaminase [Bacteroidetes bacterium]|nr:adenosine deaminase [Bacteroidota bacterium]
MWSDIFIRALESKSISEIRKVPKADLHNHAGLGYNLNRLNLLYNIRVSPPNPVMCDLYEMDAWIMNQLVPCLPATFSFIDLLQLTVDEAIDDGVAVLDTSIDLWFIGKHCRGIVDACNEISQICSRYSGKIEIRPEIGLNRTQKPDEIEDVVFELIKSGVFKSIDLYGQELEVKPDGFSKIWQYAGKYGLKRKAHAGEFDSAQMVRHAVEVLGLDEVQHGISAAACAETMKWLAENKIVLNICPTSNVKLSRVQSIGVHPARVLYDNGVRITINSDDIAVFDTTTSQEFLKLYDTGLFTARELDMIRNTGLVG